MFQAKLVEGCENFFLQLYLFNLCWIPITYETYLFNEMPFEVINTRLKVISSVYLFVISGKSTLAFNYSNSIENNVY